MTLDLSPLKRRLRKKSGEEDSVWPSLTLTLYSDQPLAKLGPHAVALLRTYMQAIPENALRSALIRDDIGLLTAQRLARDLKRFEKPLKSDDGGRIVYSSSDSGQPGDYGCYFQLLDLTDEELVGPFETNVMRLEFPWALAEGNGLEEAVELLTTLSNCAPIVCGTAAFGFSYWRGDRFAADQVRAMLPRYIGFDHSDVGANNMRGRTPCASWLTFLSGELVEKLGGTRSIEESGPSGTLHATKWGIRVRTALRPPVGDVNRGAEDIGISPAVARWLKPLRFRASAFNGSQIEMDVAAWLGRFDSLQDRPWNNRP
jgi:hypothetical protein